jgi:DNA-binding GntR family transcriptional regulator
MLVEEPPDGRAADASVAGSHPRQPLRERAYRAIKAGILAQRWRPGQPLTEQHLAAELAISRTPVREALQALAREGFVSIFPNRGTFVAALSLADIRELYELREALEGQVARLAAERATAADPSALEAVVARAAEQMHAPDQLVETGSEFHRLLARIAGNRRIQEILVNLEQSTARARLMRYGSADSRRDVWAEHRSIMEAVGRHDPDEAQRLMRSHIRLAYEFLVRRP